MDVLSSSQIEYISSLSAVEVARSQILSKTSGMVYFTVELPDEIKTPLRDILGLDLSGVAQIPMRWVKGDTVPHVDRGDTFDNTYLVYLTDSSGELILGDTHYPIARGRGYVFNEGLSHSTVGTGDEPRLLLGPMSENGVPVGIFAISGDGGTNIYIRQSGEDIEYSQDERETWSTIYRPCLITNTNTDSGMLKVLFTTDLTLTDNYWYFVCGSDKIQFGSESLNSDGTRPVMTVDAVDEYPGFIQNGYNGGGGYNNICVYNLEVRTVNDASLAEGGGWIGQSYYSNAGTDNFVINCYSDGDISLNGGGILGQYASYQGYLTIIGCSSSGDQADYSGGIVGYGCGYQGELVIESCFTTGAISGGECGGITGKNAADSGDVTISNCYTTGVIEGPGCGGVTGSYCGVNGGEITIKNCYTTGNITQDNSGGIIGSHCGNVLVSNCYTTGNVSSGDTSGGVAGTDQSNLTVQNCYVAGTVAIEGFILAGTDTIPETCYSEADNEGSGWNTTNANTVLTGYPTSVVGSVWVSNGVNQPYLIKEMGYTPYTINNIVANSLERHYCILQVGNEPEKDMDNTDFRDEFDPHNYQEDFFPGMADVIEDNVVAGDKDPDTKFQASYWDDLGDDIFDDWGYFYLYDVNTGKYYFPLLTPQNQADGVITTQTCTAFDRTFTIKHGWVTRGIFKMDITVADSLPFRYGAYGNMGSDGDEDTEDLTESYTIGGVEKTLYYRKDAESGDSDEILWTYFIPANADDNESQPYDVYYNEDNMSMVTKEVTTGITVYYAKTNNVKDWVIGQLKSSVGEGTNGLEPGESTDEAVISDLSYTILEVIGGDEDSYETITVDSTTGSISTTTSTAPGYYLVYVKNSGSYHITVYDLIVKGEAEEEEDEVVSYRRPAGTNGYDRRVVRLSTNRLTVPITSRPATSSSVGNKGDVKFVNGYIYVCTAPNTWKRLALTTF